MAQVALNYSSVEYPGWPGFHNPVTHIRYTVAFAPKTVQ